MATKVTKSKSSVKQEVEEFDKDIKTKNWLTFLVLIIWWPFKIVLYPFTWVYREFKRMTSFLTNKSNAPLNFEEIALVESTPVFFTIASIDLAIILGIFAYVGFSQRVKNFLDNLAQGFNGISGMTTAIVTIIQKIWDAINFIVVKVLILGTWSFITSFNYPPIVLLFGAGILSILIVILIMVISELNVIGRVMRKLGYFGLGIAELPRAIYDSLDHLWMKFLKTFGRKISGNFVTTKQRTFYRKIIVFVTLYALWTFAWGILILLSGLLSQTTTFSFNSENIGYMLDVILLSGFLAGTVLMLVMSRTLKALTGSRYNAEMTQIDEIRHQSLMNYMSNKNHMAMLSLSNVARLVDISKEDISNHFKDKTLTDWVLTGNAIVNDKLYKERLKYVDGLVDEGLDKEEVKLLTKGLDYLSFMEKGLRNVSYYIDYLEDHKQ